MTPKPKFPRALALQVAEELCSLLASATDRCIVAGSLRRRKTEVGDIEILYIPRYVTAPANDLFSPPSRLNLVDAILGSLITSGLLSKRLNARGSKTWGPKNKYAVHVTSGIPVDFFAADEANWFNYLVCRTGSAAHNTRIASLAQARGWKWHSCDIGFTDAVGCTLFVHSEADVFTLLGLPYLEPWQRT